MNNNKLIAEFMGWTPCDPNDSTMYANPKTGALYSSDCDMRFHTSWDWLMPVANEIIKSRDEQNADWDLTNLKYALCTTNIELVYDAVVEFIKAYNDDSRTQNN
tara:strand:+ start:992 stop:1303 length:312 start_codon:yes stop_codon:yes gene_type:complete